MDILDSINIKLILNYPFILKNVEADAIIYKGKIEIDNEDYNVNIRQSLDNNFVLQFLEGLDFFIEDINNNLIKENCDITPYLDLLKKYISSKKFSKKQESCGDVYRQVLKEYCELTEFYLNIKSCYLSYDLSKITITVQDNEGRIHQIKILVIYEDIKSIFEIVEYDFPCGKEKFTRSSNMKTVFGQISAMIETLQPVFSLMDDFDKNCDILDPVSEKKKYNYRRIWLGDTLSLIVTVDPFNLGKLPAITFLGPEKVAECYHFNINKNLEDWNQTNRLYSEILKLIGIKEFPRKPVVAENKNDDLLLKVGDCSICFSLKLNDKLPEVVCSNQFCNCYYHAECLYKWLVTVDVRTFFSEAVGRCPTCEKNISCPIIN